MINPDIVYFGGHAGSQAVVNKTAAAIHDVYNLSVEPIAYKDSSTHRAQDLASTARILIGFSLGNFAAYDYSHGNDKLEETHLLNPVIPVSITRLLAIDTPKRIRDLVSNPDAPGEQTRYILSSLGQVASHPILQFRELSRLRNFDYRTEPHGKSPVYAGVADNDVYFSHALEDYSANNVLSFAIPGHHDQVATNPYELIPAFYKRIQDLKARN